MMELSVWAVVAATAAGLLIGFSKTGVSTVSVLAVIALTMTFSAKDAVGIMLPVLVVGDIIAVAYYRKKVVWKHLVSLIPWVLAGILAGYAVLRYVDSAELSLLMGGLIMSLVVLQEWKERFGAGWSESIPHSLWFTGSMGVLAGFTTMIGNVAGVIMAVYLMSRKLPKTEFVGTGAWFFLAVNVFKLPFYAQLGMIGPDSLKVDLVMVPAVLLGTYFGVKALPLLPERLFQRAVLLMGAVGAMRLIWMAL